MTKILIGIVSDYIHYRRAIKALDDTHKLIMDVLKQNKEKEENNK
jgi:hypothetical protein